MRLAKALPNNCYNYNKTFLKKMKCDVGLMIDRDVAEKRIKKDRDVLNTHDN